MFRVRALPALPTCGKRERDQLTASLGLGLSTRLPMPRMGSLLQAIGGPLGDSSEPLQYPDGQADSLMLSIYEYLLHACGVDVLEPGCPALGIAVASDGF